MLAPEPVIRYCPSEALNSVDPFLEGPPTSPELVNAPKLLLWAKAATGSKQTNNSLRVPHIMRLLGAVAGSFFNRILKRSRQPCRRPQAGKAGNKQPR